MRFSLWSVFLASVNIAFAQYTGPAVLSRGEAPTAMAAPSIEFRPFVDVGARYTTGIAGIAVTPDGTLPQINSSGISISGGVSGVHSWAHTRLGLNYRGNYTKFRQAKSFDSFGQSLMLGLSHDISRHVSLTISENAGIFNQDYGLLTLAQSVPFDPATTSAPITDFFANRTMYANSSAYLTVQRSARLSFTAGGDYSLIRRSSAALAGSHVAGANGDVQYRVTRRSTVGAYYRFLRYAFTRTNGDTYGHSAGASYSVRLNRQWEFSGFGGFTRIEWKFIQETPIDPVIAALLGITSSAQIRHLVDWVPNWSGRLAYTRRTGVAFISGGRTVLPGNGMFNTSYSNTVFAGYNYTGLRRWSFAANGAYNNSRSISVIAGRYESASGGVSLARTIVSSVYFTANYTARQYMSGAYSNYNRLVSTAMVGIAFSPGESPLRIW